MFIGKYRERFWRAAREAHGSFDSERIARMTGDRPEQAGVFSHPGASVDPAVPFSTDAIACRPGGTSALSRLSPNSPKTLL